MLRRTFKELIYQVKVVSQLSEHYQPYFYAYPLLKHQDGPFNICSRDGGRVEATNPGGIKPALCDTL